MGKFKIISRRRFFFFVGLLTLAIVLANEFYLSEMPAQADSKATITVSSSQWGQSTYYIGAGDGFVPDQKAAFAEIKDLGLNTMRVSGQASNWEPVDDSPVYGQPSIDQLKADPNSINWSVWDKHLASNWIGGMGAPEYFSTLKSMSIRSVINFTLDHDGAGTFMANPPITQADKNEWWKYVFALAYWLNVRNDYQVNDYEVFNEPDAGSRFWHGTESQFFDFMRLTHDAIDYVYTKYLPGRSYHVLAPTPTWTNNWISDALANAPDSFDSVSYHQYVTGSELSKGATTVHGYLNKSGHSNYRIWITEWGSYDAFKDYGGGPANDSIPFGISIINGLMDISHPGDQYVFGTHYYVLHQWELGSGLVDTNEKPRNVYYALRMATRALKGGKPTYQSVASTSDINALATKDGATIYVLATNSSSSSYTVDTDLSGLVSNANTTLYQYDSNHLDSSTAGPAVSNGHVTLSIPNSGAVLLAVKLDPNAPPPTAPPAAPPVSSTAQKLVGLASKCIGTQNSGDSSGTGLILTECTSNADQKWTLTTQGAWQGINSKCVGTQNSSSSNGTGLILAECNSNADQKWTLTNQGTLQGINNKCVGTQNGKSDNGTAIILWDCNGNPDQKWAFQ